MVSMFFLSRFPYSFFLRGASALIDLDFVPDSFGGLVVASRSSLRSMFLGILRRLTQRRTLVEADLIAR